MISTYSGPLRRVLTGNSQATAFSTNPIVRKQFPGDGPFDDDTGVIGSDRADARQVAEVVLIPYCAAPKDTTFWMRVSGWRKVLHEVSGENEILWIRLPIADFACVAGELPGPALTYQQVLQGQQDNRAMASYMNLCDEIALVNGSLGPEGELFSYGPGLLQAAYTKLHLQGSRAWQVEFAANENDPDETIEMNAFWVPV